MNGIVRQTFVVCKAVGTLSQAARDRRYAVRESGGVRSVSSTQSGVPFVNVSCAHAPTVQVPTVDTNLVQSLINIMECQLKEAFEAMARRGAGGKRQSQSGRPEASSAAGAEEGPLDPQVSRPTPCGAVKIERRVLPTAVVLLLSQVKVERYTVATTFRRRTECTHDTILPVRMPSTGPVITW